MIIVFKRRQKLTKSPYYQVYRHLKRQLTYLFSLSIAIYMLRPIDLRHNQVFGVRILAENGELLSTRLADDDQWRFAPMTELPSRYVKCLIHYEDKRFNYHPGIDPISIVRALKTNISHNKINSGASTITMQLARMLRKYRHRSLANKLAEAILALRIELWHSKKDILRHYAAYAPYGGNVVGIEAASWRYFDKSPDLLTWSESATLAVLPNAPGLIHPGRNQETLFTKKNRLLASLNRAGIIDDIEYSLAIQEPIHMLPHQLPQFAPHFLAAHPSQENSHIHYAWQLACGALLDRQYHQWKQNEIHNAAILLIENKTGATKVYHGNIPHTSHEKDVNMITARRSSGSILKPILYAASIDKSIISPYALLDDIPLYINGFHPTNYDKSYHGSIHADRALSKSLNVPFVQLLRLYGVDPFLRLLRKMNITTVTKDAEHYGLSIILGGAEVRLIDLAMAYANMSEILRKNDLSSALSPEAIYYTFEAMRRVERPNDRGQWEKYESSIPIAWKTGTSYGHRDAWAVGCTPEYTIATWVGNADGEGREGLLGGKTAGDLLFGVLDIIAPTPQWWELPGKQLVAADICENSGHLAGSHCNHQDRKMIPLHTLRTMTCTYHKPLAITESGYRIEGECTHDGIVTTRSFFVLPPRNAQYYKHYHADYEELPPLLPTCQQDLAEQSLQFIYPIGNQALMTPHDFNLNRKAIIYKAAHKDPEATIFWYLDKEFLGATTGEHKIMHIPPDGIHTLTIMDQYGNSLSQFLKIVANPIKDKAS